jgi:hypothetical protein
MTCEESQVFFGFSCDLSHACVSSRVFWQKSCDYGGSSMGGGAPPGLLIADFVVVHRRHGY